MIKTAIKSAAVLGLFAFMLSLSTVDYVCKPYKPTETCRQGRYEIKIYESYYVYMREPLAFIEADCIWDIGGRYKASDVWFHTPPARSEYMEFIELPKKHIEICRVE